MPKKPLAARFWVPEVR
jgi:hypothetical protein